MTPQQQLVALDTTDEKQPIAVALCQGEPGFLGHPL